MEVEIARVRYEVDQAEVDERHETQEEQGGLQEFLPIRLMLLSRPHLLFYYPGVDERMRHDELAEIQRSRQREISDRRRVYRPRIDGASCSVGLRQQREQVGLERP